MKIIKSMEIEIKKKVIILKGPYIIYINGKMKNKKNKKIKENEENIYK